MEDLCPGGVNNSISSLTAPATSVMFSNSGVCSVVGEVEKCTLRLVERRRCVDGSCLRLDERRLETAGESFFT